MIETTLVILVGALAFWFLKNKTQKQWMQPESNFPSKWRTILIQKVGFYNALNKEEKNLFEYKTQEFLLNHRITGIKTNINITDKLLVASSAVIPIFKFPAWRYTNLFEILL